MVQAPRAAPQGGSGARVGVVVLALHAVPSSRKPGWVGCATRGEVLEQKWVREERLMVDRKGSRSS